MAKLTKSFLTLGEKVNGDPLTVPVFTFSSASNIGPKVYIQANMHGAEVQGNAVIYQLMEQLKDIELNAEVTLVPFANPIGCNGKSGEYTLGRYDPVTGNNWNRHYFYNDDWIESFAFDYLKASNEEVVSSFRERLIGQISAKLNSEYGVATTTLIDLSVQRLAMEADIVLDLHTGPISAAHLYCPEYNIEKARFFNIPHVLLIPDQFDGALDEACFCPWWKLQQEFNKLGRVEEVFVDAFTIELGSQEKICFNQAESDAESILSYLSSQNVLQNKKYTPETMQRFGCYLKDYKVLFAKQGGLVEYLTEPGTKLRKGDVMARQMSLHNYPEKTALADILAPEDLITILHYPSASVYPGAGLYKMFTQYFEL